MSQLLLVGLLAFAFVILYLAVDQLRNDRSKRTRATPSRTGRPAPLRNREDKLDARRSENASSRSDVTRQSAAPRDTAIADSARSAATSISAAQSSAPANTRLESARDEYAETLDFTRIDIARDAEGPWRPHTLSETTKELIDRFGSSLPEPSLITTRMAGALDDPEATPRKIARVASSDPLLAAKILTAVNSPLFGLPKKTSDLKQAVMMLGYGQIKRIVYRLLISQSFQASAGTEEQHDEIWEHSFLVSSIAPILAKEAGIGHTGPLATAGLLLDVGKMALLRNDTPAARVIYNRSATEDRLLCKDEEEAFGMNHGVAGALLARKWNLPVEIVSMIELHVQLHFSPTPIVRGAAMKALCILHLADAFVSDWRAQLAEIAFEDGEGGTERASYEPDASIFEAVGFEPSLAALATPAIEKAMQEGTEFMGSLASGRQARAAGSRRAPAAAAIRV
jgi:HD-like signal output (HDOD) protein